MATNHLRIYRTRAGYSVLAFSRICRLSTTQVYDIESGKHWPRAKTRLKICQGLRIAEGDVFPPQYRPEVDTSSIPHYVTTEWRLSITCPHCRGSFRMVVYSAGPPTEISCPMCGFRQSIKMDRG
jgi:DNA-binding XRE family transcriptional regulator